MDIGEIFEQFSDEQGENQCLYRNRPYCGQMHTDSGERGKTEVKGVTFRDLRDAFVLGMLLAANDQFTDEFYDKIEKRQVCYNDIYKIDGNKIDPMAAAQCMSIEIEKMMGIYPNVPPLKEIEPDPPGGRHGE